MSTSITEVEIELEDLLSDLLSCFEDFGFKTEDNLEAHDLLTHLGFKKFVNPETNSLSFVEFKKKVKNDFFSLDDSLPVSDFDQI